MNQEEKNLRSNIRHLIRYVKQKKATDQNIFKEQILKLAGLELKSMLHEVSKKVVSLPYC